MGEILHHKCVYEKKTIMVWSLRPARSPKRPNHVSCAVAKKGCPNSTVAGHRSSGFVTTIFLTKSRKSGLLESRGNLDRMRPVSRFPRPRPGCGSPQSLLLTESHHKFPRFYDSKGNGNIAYRCNAYFRCSKYHARHQVEVHPG